MPRQTNPNQKPIAGKRELSGAEKERKRKKLALDTQKESIIAAKFFKKTSSTEPAFEEGKYINHIHNFN